MPNLPPHRAVLVSALSFTGAIFLIVGGAAAIVFYRREEVVLAGVYGASAIASVLAFLAAAAIVEDIAAMRQMIAPIVAREAVGGDHFPAR